MSLPEREPLAVNTLSPRASRDVTENFLYDDTIEARELEKVITIAKLKHRGQVVSQGQFLPLLIDKVRNNIRSRFLLSCVYAVATAVVALVLILSYSPEDSGAWRVVFSLPPASTVAISEPMSPFALQVFDHKHRGVSNITCVATLIPVGPIPLTAIFDEDNVLSRTVKCTRTLLLQLATERDDLIFCQPHRRGLLLGNVQSTNSDGVAFFENFTIGLAVPGTYLLLLTLEEYDYTLSSYIIVTASMHQILTSHQGNNQIVEIVPDSTAEPAAGVSVSLFAKWTPSATTPMFACAAVISLNLQGRFRRERAILEPLSDVVSKTPFIVADSQTRCTKNFNILPTGEYTVNMSWTFFVEATNTNEMFFGMSFMGDLLPISSVDLSTPTMSPAQVVLSFKTSNSTSIRTVTACGLQPTITEVQPLGIVVRVLGDGGVPIVGKTVFLHVIPSVDNGPQVGTLAMLSPGIMPKFLIADFNKTNASGHASFALTLFSGVNSSGYYDVEASCDGIVADWGGGHFHYNTFVNLSIDVALSASTVLWHGEGIDTVEVIGSPWLSLPTVNLLDSLGRPVPGKFTHVRCTNVTQAAVASTSLPSNSEGHGAVVFVIVNFRDGGSGTLEFELCVDSTVIITFYRTIALPADYVYQQATTDASFRFTSLPKLTFADIPNFVVGQCVDQAGEMQPFANLTVTVSKQFLQPQYPNSDTVWTIQADENGYATFQLNAPYIFRYTALYAYFQCNAALSSASGGIYLSAIFRSRVKYLIVNPGPRPNSFAVQIVPYEWYRISSVTSIFVNLSIVWFPGYVSAYFDESDFPTSRAEFISSNQTGSNTAIVTLSRTENFPGRYGVVFNVGSCIFGPLTMLTFPIPNITLECVRTAFSLPFKVGIPLPFPPIVRVTDSITNQSRSDVKIIAQLVVLNGDGTWTPLQYFVNTSSCLSGVFLRLSDSFPYISKALSDPSNSTGFAVFTGLIPIALTPGYVVTFRYCANLDVTYDAAGDDVYSTCVYDPQNISITSAQQTTFALSTTILSGTPGKYLPDINITAILNGSDGGAPGIACSPSFHFSGISYMSFPSSPYVPYGTFYGLGPLLTISRSIELVSTMPSGTYQLYFACSGGLTPNVTVIVSDAVAEISVVSGLAPTFQVQSFQTLQLQLLSNGRQPVSNVPVMLGYYNNELNENPFAPVYGWQGGLVAPGSKLFAVTDLYGVVNLAVAFRAATTGNFTFVVSLPGSMSIRRLQEAASSSIIQTESDFGASFKRTLQYVNAYSPAYTSLFSLYSTLQQASTTTFYESSDATFQEAFGILPSATGITSPTLSIPVEVINPVARVIFLRPLKAEFALSGVTIGKFGFSPQSFSITGDECPIVQLLDAAGAPVANTGVIVQILPDPSPPTALVYDSAMVSGNDGVLVVCPMTLVTDNAFSKKLFISSFGGGGNFTDTVVVSPPIALTTLQLMRVIAVVLVVLFSPMLFASVPHSKQRYHLIAIVNTITQFVVALAAASQIPSVLAFQWYYNLLLAFMCLVCATTVAIAIMDYLAYGRGFYSLRIFNDENKAVLVYKYTKWIVNITAEKQKRHEEIGVETNSGYEAMELGTVQSDLSPITSESALSRCESEITTSPSKKANKKHNLLRDPLKLLHAAEGLVTRLTHHHKHGKRRIFKARRPTLLYNRPELEPIYLPFTFVIVIVITAVLFVVQVFIILYVFNVIYDYASLVESYLPSVAEVQKSLAANALIIQGISATIMMVVKSFPSLYGLTALIGHIQQFDLVKLFSEIHSGINDVVLAIEILFGVAAAVSIAVVLFSIWQLLLKIPTLIRGIRRGRIKSKELDGEITPIEGYIGLHVMHLVLLQQMVFWGVVLLSLLVAISPIRNFLYDKLKILAVASAISFAIQIAIQSLLIKKFLTKRKYFVVRPELYALWHFAGLILGVFTGVVKSIVRLATAYGMVTVMFARLDHSIFPTAFVRQDGANEGFRGMVIVEAKNGNPIFLIFSTILITHKELRHRAHDCARSADRSCFPVESLFSGDACTSSCIKNLTVLFLRDDSSTLKETSLDDDVSLSKPPTRTTIDLSPFIDHEAYLRREKVRQRFWLWWLLTKNPSLIDERKHNLVFEEEESTSGDYGAAGH